MPWSWCRPAPYLRLLPRAAASGAGGFTSLSVKRAARNFDELMSIATCGCEASASCVGFHSSTYFAVRLLRFTASACVIRRIQPMEWPSSLCGGITKLRPTRNWIHCCSFLQCFSSPRPVFKRATIFALGFCENMWPLWVCDNRLTADIAWIACAISSILERTSMFSVSYSMLCILWSENYVFRRKYRVHFWPKQKCGPSVTQYFEAVSSRGKEWCVEVLPIYCHGPECTFVRIRG